MDIIREGEVCEDCALILASGEDSCEEEPCPHGEDLPIHAVLGEQIGEFHVPFRPCDGCGTRLAGTWFSWVELG